MAEAGVATASATWKGTSEQSSHAYFSTHKAKAAFSSRTQQQGEQCDPPSCRQWILQQHQDNTWTTMAAMNNLHRGETAGLHHQEHHYLSSFTQQQLPASVKATGQDQ
ncbi:hypothetical protein Nepgr_032241 [Nepenthes gracilis]|uniref:Uncharacterized protein n=1 Tax=Nepenthes gracilis TaxID=150966 RepID=A0AAD3TK26_NEPGR|nr:hypothetical protein Nepgr_032241 [Nepenthes gracilis]